MVGGFISIFKEALITDEVRASQRVKKLDCQLLIIIILMVGKASEVFRL